MSRYYYDLHIHSCLSPCADNDNTPNNIAGMASLCGLNIIALTDHNSCKNCPPFFEACQRYGIIPVAGMELTTAEDIHVLCLFEELENAMSFDSMIGRRRMLIKNRVDVFGNQLILDGQDNIIGEEEYFLSNATDVSIESVIKLVSVYDGICYPAHIDRQANGIISVLGTFPEIPNFKCVEINRPEKQEEYTQKYGLSDKQVIISSDAHYLTDIRDKKNYFDIDDEPYSAAMVRKKLFEILR
ncbi:MAG: PHP domain-containing protein [Clostridia bacterium]|nr:PHP domain-containing protein [Clostridia bacterium]